MFWRLCFNLDTFSTSDNILSFWLSLFCEIWKLTSIKNYKHTKETKITTSLTNGFVSISDINNDDLTDLFTCSIGGEGSHVRRVTEVASSHRWVCVDVSDLNPWNNWNRDINKNQNITLKISTLTVWVHFNQSADDNSLLAVNKQSH